MKEKIENRKLNKKKLFIFILLIVVFLGILVGVSFAKYQSRISLNSFANIAKPILELRSEQSMLITALSPKATYTFEVRNFKENDNQLNQVEMEYYIEILSNTDDAIKFELYKEDEEIPLLDNKTKNIKLTNDKKEIHSYRLEITYDKTKGEEKDIKEDVEIKIHSIQKT